MMMKLTFVYLIAATLVSFSTPNFSPPKWEGTWECYSSIHSGTLLGTIEIVKTKGKEYSWKYNFQNDDNISSDRACSKLSFEGKATYNGVNGLNTTLKGIGFTYYAEGDKIVPFHDYSDEELVSQSLCFGGDFIRKK